jgi:protein-disulfide isomerase
MVLERVSKEQRMKVSEKFSLSVFCSLMLWVAGIQVEAAPLSEAQGEAILSELKQIRQLLERQQQAPLANAPQPAPRADERASTSIADTPFIGKLDAPLVLVMFTDYQCPFCKRFETEALPELKRQYVDTGKVRFVVRDLPLVFHPNALKAAESTHCASEQGKYWELRQKLVENSDKLEAKWLPDYAQQAGLDVAKFSACLDSDRYAEKAKASAANAATLNITGTPTFIVGRLNGDIVEGIKMVGAMPFAVFDQKIKSLLDNKK